MKTALRYLACVVILAAALAAIHAYVVIPFRCNQEKKRATQTTTEAFKYTGSFAAIQSGRATMIRLAPCFRAGCLDVPLYMAMAANARLAGRSDEAIRLYTEALELDHRPEIYYNLAEAQLQLGRRVEAYHNYIEAVLFNPFFLHEIDDGDLRSRVYQQVIQRRPREKEFYKYVNETPVLNWH